MENAVNCIVRECYTKGDNNRLRNNGKIPGVIYGLNRNNLNVEFGELELFHALAEIGEHGVVEVDADGIREMTIIKEIQRDPITRKVIHIDLRRIDTNKRVHTHVPIVFKGEEALKGIDSVVQPQMDSVEIECPPEKLPKYVTVDVSRMKQGKKITYDDIEVSEEISIIGNMHTIIATISKIKSNIKNSEENDGSSTVLKDE